MYRDTVSILSYHRRETFTHITGSILGKCQTEDIGWEVVSRLEYVRYTRGEELRLTTPWSGDHEYRSVDRLDSFELFIIQGCEDILEIHRKKMIFIIV